MVTSFCVRRISFSPFRDSKKVLSQAESSARRWETMRTGRLPDLGKRGCGAGKTDVLLHRSGKNLIFLKNAGNRPAKIRKLPFSDIPPEKEKTSGCGFEQAADQPEKSGLSHTAFSGNPDALAGSNTEGNPVQNPGEAHPAADNGKAAVRDTGSAICPLRRKGEQIVQPTHGFFRFPKIVQRAEQIDDGSIDLTDELTVREQQRDGDISPESEDSAEQKGNDTGHVSDRHDEGKGKTYVFRVSLPNLQQLLQNTLHFLKHNALHLIRGNGFRTLNDVAGCLCVAGLDASLIFIDPSRTGGQSIQRDCKQRNRKENAKAEQRTVLKQIEEATDGQKRIEQQVKGAGTKKSGNSGSIAVVAAEKLSGGNTFCLIHADCEQVPEQSVSDGTDGFRFQPPGKAFKQSISQHHRQSGSGKGRKGCRDVAPVSAKDGINEPLNRIYLKKAERNQQEGKEQQHQKIEPVLFQISD